MAEKIASVNRILAPLMFQVVGSTPDSIRDNIKRSNLKGDPETASLLVAACVFAMVVNKATVENFLAKPEMLSVRPIVSSVFSISGRSNMTSLTLLGHCLLTSEFTAEIEFAAEFRRKMGQNHVWAGDLSKGSLSEKQKTILLEKQRTNSAADAKLLGSGFYKYTGIDIAPMTVAEANFWGEAITTTSAAAFTTTVSSPASAPGSPSRGALRSETFVLSDGSTVEIPARVAMYYRKAVNPDPNALVASIEKRTAEGFIRSYSALLEADPEMKGRAAGTVV